MPKDTESVVPQQTKKTDLESDEKVEAASAPLSDSPLITCGEPGDNVLALIDYPQKAIANTPEEEERAIFNEDGTLMLVSSSPANQFSTLSGDVDLLEYVEPDWDEFFCSSTESEPAQQKDLPPPAAPTQPPIAPPIPPPASSPTGLLSAVAMPINHVLSAGEEVVQTRNAHRNLITVCGEYAYISVKKVKSREYLRIKIDKDKLDGVKNLKWAFQLYKKSFYIRTKDAKHYLSEKLFETNPYVKKGLPLEIMNSEFLDFTLEGMKQEIKRLIAIRGPEWLTMPAFTVSILPPPPPLLPHMAPPPPPYPPLPPPPASSFMPPIAPPSQPMHTPASQPQMLGFSMPIQNPILGVSAISTAAPALPLPPQSLPIGMFLPPLLPMALPPPPLFPPAAPPMLPMGSRSLMAQLVDPDLDSEETPVQERDLRHNKITTLGEYAYIYVKKPNSNDFIRVKIDKAILPEVKDKKWKSVKQNAHLYVQNTSGQRLSAIIGGFLKRSVKRVDTSDECSDLQDYTFANFKPSCRDSQEIDARSTKRQAHPILPPPGMVTSASPHQGYASPPPIPPVTPGTPWAVGLPPIDWTAPRGYSFSPLMPPLDQQTDPEETFGQAGLGGTDSFGYQDETEYNPFAPSPPEEPTLG